LVAEINVQRGLYFEEFTVGDSLVTAGRTITEADIVNFAALSGDWTTIHTDAEFAKSIMFGERIAHGALVLSVATGLAVRSGVIEGTVIAFRELTWKYSGVVKIGDTVRVRLQIAEKKAMPRLGGGSVLMNVEVVNQRDETVQRGTWTMLVKSKPA
jgi:3-hydroxybutyryl-CoA dehydratase